MQFDPQAPVVVVPVQLRGDTATRIVDMVLDTGATYIVVPWHLAQTLGYDPAGSNRSVNLTTASSVETAPLIYIGSVSPLGQEVENVDAVCLDLPPGSRAEGLLGLSFLRHLDLDLHFRSGTLEARGT